MKGLLKVCICLLFVSIGAIYGTAMAQTNMQTKMKALINDSLLVKAQVGISIRNTLSGHIVYEHNGNKSFTPASNLKLVTTAAALSILGSDYTFNTKLVYFGEPVNGVFKGSLKIIGSGDPTLGSDKMPGVPGYQDLIRLWATKIRNLGITTFEGNLIIDPLKYEYNPLPKDYTWGDIGNYYGAGNYGLNLNENQCVIQFKPGNKAGDPTQVISIVPWDSSWHFTNYVYTGISGSGDKSIIYSSPYNTNAFAEGTIPPGTIFQVKGSIPDPASLTAMLLINEMKLQGIVWKGRYIVLKPEETMTIISSNEWKMLHQQISPAVSAIIRQTNVVSNNLYAETLLKEISAKKGEIAATNSSLNYVKRYIRSIGIDTTGITLRDGSGMSPFNCISPNQLTHLLYKMSENKLFANSLPVAGRDGTVNHICKGTGEQIRIKSGTMNGITCYSGYIKSNSGIVYSVSFLINKHEAKNRVIQKVLEGGLLAIRNE